MLFEFIFNQLMDEASHAGANLNIEVRPDGTYDVEVYQTGIDGAIYARRTGQHLCTADLDKVRVELQATISHMRDWP
jgi:hypothetical protein